MIGLEDILHYASFLDDETRLEYIGYIYNIAVASMPPPVHDFLERARRELSDPRCFYQALLTQSGESGFLGQPIGKVTSRRLDGLATRLRTLADNEKAQKIYNSNFPLEELAPQVEGMMKTCPKRVYNSYKKYFAGCCQNSIARLYFLICLTDKETADYPSLGSKYNSVMYQSLDKVKELIEKLATDSDSIDGALFSSKWSTLGLENDALYLYKKLNYFPLFKALELEMENQDPRDVEINRSCLNIWSTNGMRRMDYMASTLDLSRERVRQLRNSSLEKITNLATGIVSKGIASFETYDLTSEHEIGSIAKREETHFNINFVSWILSLFREDYVLVGDYTTAFLKFPPSRVQLYLVPANLSKVFDFEALLANIERLLSRKRVNDYRADLEAFVEEFFLREVPPAIKASATEECRRIFMRGYPNCINNNRLLFVANARKKVPDIIEDVIREFNRPMTAEELCNILNERYPGLNQTPTKVGVNALRNNNISPISRTSTYTLNEWEDTNKRGGTLRELAAEYLNGLDEPLAPIADICGYISNFRSNVSESSIQANLLAESSCMFSLYRREDMYYIGLTNLVSDPSYEIIEREQRIRRSFAESIELLEKFIRNSGRFPYSSGVDEEEKRLHRFYNTAKSNRARGVLSEDERAEVERIDSTYADCHIRKEKVVSWRQHFDNFARFITIDEVLPPADSAEYLWFKENERKLRQGRLSPSKTSEFSALVKIVSRMQPK